MLQIVRFVTGSMVLLAATAVRPPRPAAPAPAPAPARAPARAPSVTWYPERPTRGSLVRIEVGVTPGDSLRAVGGLLAGEPLHLERMAAPGAGHWRGYGGIPVTASDSIGLSILLEHADRHTDSLLVPIPLAPTPWARPASAGREARLRVAPRFGRLPDSAVAARIAREVTEALRIARASHDTPRLWRAPFMRPRSSRITSGFGAGREFNGVVQSTHAGVDFAGKRGAPVRAANRGVVALVADFYLAGHVVYINHGAGLVTGYFHLSRADVAVGDTVARGQVIGRVGATGRVTGPHLHWTARYGGVTVDPLTVLAVTRE